MSSLTKPSGIRHHLTLDENNMYMCPYCSYKTIKKNTCSEHISRLHPIEAGRTLNPNQCPYCPEKFQRKSPMYHHINTFHEISLQKCPSCNESFKNKTTLCAHYVRTHMNPTNMYIETNDLVTCKNCFKNMKKPTFYYHAAICFHSSPFCQIIQ